MAVRKPVVFISSTAEDLGAYRGWAENAAKRAGCSFLKFEDWAAKPDPAIGECLRQVDEADVLVVIVAHRYGWIPPGESKSINTQLECEHAAKRGIPLLVFVVDDKCDWPLHLDDSYRSAAATKAGKWTPELQASVQRDLDGLREFKSWLQDGRTWKPFDLESNFEVMVYQALQEFVGEEPEADTTAYLKTLREQTGYIDIKGLQVGSGKAHTFGIDELYVPLSTTSRTGMGQELVDLETALGNRRLVITGDPGAGKTTFVRRLANQLCRAGLEGRGAVALPWLGKEALPLPVLIKIEELIAHVEAMLGRNERGAPTTHGSPEWLLHFATRAGTNAPPLESLRRKAAAGQCIFLLDGLDQAPNDVTRRWVAQIFELATTTHSGCRFVVTTRPRAFQGTALLRGFGVVGVEPLPPESVALFLQRWCDALFAERPGEAASHLEGLQSSLKAKREIRRMTANPVMLTALAVLHWNDRRLPDQRAELYESIVGWLAQARELPGRARKAECLRVLGQLALAMMQHSKGRQTQVTRAWAGNALAGLFGGDALKAAEFVETEEGDSGIVVSRGSEVAFWHLTFQEFLAAWALSSMTDGPLQELVVRYAYAKEWRETILLLCGLLAVRGPDRVDGIVSALIDNLPTSAKLSDKARCVGVIGSIVGDLRPSKYGPADERYDFLLKDVLAIFDRHEAAQVPFQETLDAAEALGQAGDPRLRENNWIRIEAGGAVEKAFEIGKYPVTVEEYQRYLDEASVEEKERPGGWEEQLEHPNWPVTRVSWYQASAYCNWAGIQLPTDRQWSRVAEGVEGRKYPWGEPEPDDSRANYGKKVGHATPVGLYPAGATPEGVLDLAGNVWEWTRDWNDIEQKVKILRGGSWISIAVSLGASVRVRDVPGLRSDGTGFRGVREV